MQYLKQLWALVFACLIFCGCAAVNEKLRYEPDSASVVCIGAVLPLSGPYADFGEKMLNGAVLAVDELNSSRGHFGRRVKIVVFDSAGTAQGAAAAFEKAVSAGAVGIVGGYSTNEVKAMTSLARQYRVPLVIPMATGNDDVINMNPFVFRITFTDGQQAEIIAGYLKYYRKAKHIAIAISSDAESAYTRNMASETADAFRKLGGTPTVLREIKSGQLERELQEIASLRPDAVLLPFEGKTAARSYKLLRQYGYPGLICGPDSWNDRAFFEELKGVKNLGNSFYIAFYNEESANAEFRNFKTAFRKKLFYQPGSCEVQSFDAVNMLLTGFGKDADTLKRFEKNWLGMRQYVGAAALYTMSAGNKIDRTVYINRVGVSSFDKNKFVPRNITGIQYSRLKAYAIGDE